MRRIRTIRLGKNSRILTNFNYWYERIWKLCCKMRQKCIVHNFKFNKFKHIVDWCCLPKIRIVRLSLLKSCCTKTVLLIGFWLSYTVYYNRAQRSLKSRPSMPSRESSTAAACDITHCCTMSSQHWYLLPRCWHFARRRNPNADLATEGQKLG